MALPLNQAQAIAQRLSNDQLMKSYTDGSLPQFIVFSEMQRRQQAVNSAAKMPKETVAEQMVGRPIGERPDVGSERGLSSLEPPVTAKTGGFISSLAMMDLGSLPPIAQKELNLRASNMPTGSYLSKQADSNYAKGGIVGYADGTGDDTVSSDDGSDQDGSDDSQTGSGGGGSPPPVTSGEINKNVVVQPQYIYNKLVRDYGYSPQAAAAIAGNIQHESGGGTGTVEIGAKNPGRGFVQWDKTRFNNLVNFAKDRNTDPYDPDTQIAFIDHELKTTEKPSGKKLFAANDIKSAHNAFLGYLRPRDYSEKNPSQTIAYNKRLANAASILGIGSMKPDNVAEGADTLDPRTVGISSAFNPPGGSLANIYQREPQYNYTKSNENKGLSALGAASYLEDLAQSRRKLFSNGGPVFLRDGTDGDTVKAYEDQKSRQQFTDIMKAMGYPDPYSVPAKAPDTTPTNLSPEPDLEYYRRSSPYGAGAESGADILGRNVFNTEETLPAEEQKTSRFGRLSSDIKSGITGAASEINKFMSPSEEQIARSNRLEALRKELKDIEVGPFTPQTKSEVEATDKRRQEIWNEITEISSGKKKFTTQSSPQDTTDTSGFGMTDWSKYSGSGIPSAMSPTEREKFLETNAPELAGKGIPSARAGSASPFTGPEPAPGSIADPGTTPPSGAAGDKTPPGPPGVKPPSGVPTAGATERDSDFNSVMAQVKQSIGSDLSKEFLEQKKDFQKNLASLQNDKLVDTLMAAAKAFAGQRKGQFNIGDAVANAGLAAQEAQKRIYKAEDDMRKYRLDLLKAQDEGNYKAANIAMQRIIQSDHDRKSLQIASMQADKAHKTAEMQMNRYEKMYDLQGKRATLTALHNRAETIRKSYMTGMPMSEEDKAEMGRINTQIDDLTSQLGGKVAGVTPTYVYDPKSGKLNPYSAS